MSRCTNTLPYQSHTDGHATATSSKADPDTDDDCASSIKEGAL